jgi:hypothetical protein
MKESATRPGEYSAYLSLCRTGYLVSRQLFLLLFCNSKMQSERRCSSVDLCCNIIIKLDRLPLNEHRPGSAALPL